ncbi:MAG: hypothetical protein HFG95_12735 [Dorea sp.]|nr:hypothetical protein [Dorea sp.]
MVDFTFRRGMFRIREMAFGEIDNRVNKCDVLYFHSMDISCKYEPDTTFILNKQYTLLNDLSKSEEELQNSIKKNCRYEIRRAEREEATFQVYTDFNTAKKQNVIDNFENTYNEMFKSKQLSLQFNRRLVESAFKSKQCIITVSQIPLYENIAVYHAYLMDEENAMLMYSASSIWCNNNKEVVNCIGRMNKFLHWKEMQWLKEKKVKRLEWGGISSPVKPNGIDKFKMEFGGNTVCYNNYIIAKSSIGKLYVRGIKFRQSQRGE